MTIRRQWLIVLIFIAILTIIVNSVVLGFLMNKYFVGYSIENYQKSFGEIVDYSKNALTDENLTEKQIETQLESYLDDPIIRIKLYDSNGIIIADVANNSNLDNKMMRSKMMDNMMGKPSEEVDSEDIFDDSGKTLGKLNIIKYSSVENSMSTRMYNIALFSNSFLSLRILLIFVVIIGLIISRKMSKDLTNITTLALGIELGNEINIKPSNVREIRTIQNSLETLNSRLKLKQKSRKKLLDEMVHQTRTPLTILRTHLEGFEDGIIDMTPEEIKTCENQIENITLIITNMSGMLDADKEIDQVKYEEFELNQLLKQVVGGLKVQFDKKNIELKLTSDKKIVMNTDKYKLSQSIYNILTNAYKFTEKNGKVTLSYGIIKEEIVISIEDTGIGMNSEDKKHIFDAYYKGSNSSKSTGEGLGLYIVKENLDKINGTIDVVSELGAGSKFTITIPM